MGRNRAIEMLSCVGEEVALRDHLQANHYPPIHESFIPIAQQAIERAAEAVFCEDESIWQEAIEMPNGKTLTVSEIYEGLHLEPFVEYRLAQGEQE